MQVKIFEFLVAAWEITKGWFTWVIKIDLRVVAAAIVAIGILHICATFAAPHLAGKTAYEKLVPILPTNSFVILPPVRPGRQPLPFMGPDVRYTMCRYDTTDKPVTVTAALPGKGWSLAIQSTQGETLYVATGQDGRPTVITVQLVRSAEHFQGLTPESLGFADNREAPQSVQSRKGIAVVRAPDQGLAYDRSTVIGLRRAKCWAAGKRK